MINIQKNISLAQYTTFKIGGPASFFVVVKSEDDLKEALEYAKKNNLKCFILGGGSNILVSDRGFDGLVIKIENDKCEIKGDKIVCEAGVSLSKIVSASVKNSLSGLEWAAGIPGTIGGAVRGNAGAFDADISQSVVLVRAIKEHDFGFEIVELENNNCEFEYRGSIFKKEKGWIITLIILQLKQDSSEKCANKVGEIIKKRLGSNPKYPSVGSIFKNSVNFNELKKCDKKMAEYITKNGIANRMGNVSAGFLIDYLDLKGKKIGGAEISKEHGNFIINTGNATAEDVIILISLIKQKVRNKLGVQLAEEFQYVGF